MLYFTVIGFGREKDGLAGDAEFLKRISDATLESLLLLAAQPEKLEVAPIIEVSRMKGQEQRFGPEGAQYGSIYFLNEAAFAMCRELGLSLPVIGQVESMPGEVSYEMQAHYLPLEHRKSFERHPDRLRKAESSDG